MLLAEPERAKYALGNPLERIAWVVRRHVVETDGEIAFSHREFVFGFHSTTLPLDASHALCVEDGWDYNLGPMTADRRTARKAKLYLKSRHHDAKVLGGISKLTLPERFGSIQVLKAEVEKAEVALAQKQTKSERTQKQERQIMADEDGLIELKHRLQLEEAEYRTMKSITPDFEEPSQT